MNRRFRPLAQQPVFYEKQVVVQAQHPHSSRDAAKTPRRREPCLDNDVDALARAVRIGGAVGGVTAASISGPRCQRGAHRNGGLITAETIGAAPLPRDVLDSIKGAGEG